MRRLFVLMTSVVMSVLMIAPASAGGTDNQGLFDFVEFNDSGDIVSIPGHTSVRRVADGVNLHAHLRGLTPGNAVTVWAVIWNDPDVCEGPCGSDDVVAHAVVAWTGMGGVASRGGTLNLRSSFDLGFYDSHPVVQGYFTDPAGAEIHLIVQDHGPYTGNPAQITEFLGGCNPTCTDIQASVHQP